MKKSCTKCKQIKEITYFFSDKQKKDGLSSKCKVCATLQSLDYQRRNKHVKRFIILKNKYGITKVDFEKKHKKQHGVCAICGDNNNGLTLCVDHCHKTNRVRGLLCSKCNWGIGSFNDDVKKLKNAIKYIKIWQK